MRLDTENHNPTTPDLLQAEYYTEKELAKYLDSSVRTLRRWAMLHKGPARTICGRKILYRRATVLQWLVSQEEGRGKRHKPK